MKPSDWVVTALFAVSILVLFSKIRPIAKRLLLGAVTSRAFLLSRKIQIQICKTHLFFVFFASSDLFEELFHWTQRLKRKLRGAQPKLQVFVSFTDPHSFALLQVTEAVELGSRGWVRWIRRCLFARSLLCGFEFRFGFA